MGLGASSPAGFVTIVPYFTLKDESKRSDLKNTAMPKCVDLTKSEPGCIFYGFSMSGDKYYCREGYANGRAAVAHIDNVGEGLKLLLECGDLNSIELHGPANELAKCKATFDPLNTKYWVFYGGFRKKSVKAQVGDTACSIHPYFTIKEGKSMDEVKAACDAAIEQSKSEDKCLYYGFNFEEGGKGMFCREGYADGDGVLAHLANVDEQLKMLLDVANLDRIEFHGPAAELEKLKESTAALNPIFYELESGFRRALA